LNMARETADFVEIETAVGNPQLKHRSWVETGHRIARRLYYKSKS
jgi:hypothetical protein